MKITCNFYIIISILLLESLQRSKLVATGYLSRKLDSVDLSSIPANRSSKRIGRSADKLPDKIYIVETELSANQRSLNRARREAKLPGFLLQLPESFHHRRQRRRRQRLRRHLRQEGGRSIRDAATSRNRKRKRNGLEINKSTDNSSTTEPISPNGEVPAPDPNADNNPAQVLNESSHIIHDVTYAVVICLIAVIASGLLLVYLWKSSEQKPPFFCPPDIGLDQANLDDLESCTCCSEAAPNRPEDRPMDFRRANQSLDCSMKKPTKMKKKKKTAMKPKKKLFARKQSCKVTETTRISEAELRDLQNKIACILRNQCASCECCKCNAVNANQPKCSRFQFFRRKKKSEQACDDSKCSENKIRQIADLCREQREFRIVSGNHQDSFGHCSFDPKSIKKRLRIKK